MKGRQLVSSDEATRSNVQHKRPCADCPWRRKALAGWLGGYSARDWLLTAHADVRIDCHTVKGKPQPQCAGAAIYRANVCKRVEDPRALKLEPDREAVFASPMEFTAHHDLERKKA